MGWRLLSSESRNEMENFDTHLIIILIRTLEMLILVRNALENEIEVMKASFFRVIRATRHFDIMRMAV